MTEVWETRIAAEHVASFGLTEIHAVFFQHIKDPGGLVDCVAVQIPETPPPMIVHALLTARHRKARLVFICDTAEQAVDAALVGKKQLRHHRRVSLERAQAGGWSLT